MANLSIQRLSALLLYSAGASALFTAGGGGFAGEAVAQTQTPSPFGTSTWTRCASENGTCAVPGTAQVRYGLDGKYAYKVATGSIACSNAAFGDPYPGARKVCDIETVPPPPVTWTQCAIEHETCTVPASTQVRYGLNGSYAFKTLTGAFECGNEVFGDPLPGARKVCEVAATAGTPAPVPDPDPTPTPSPVVKRDPLKWPFAATSIWNTPVGSGARYVPANLPAVPGNDSWAPMPQLDKELIVLRPKATVTPVYYSSVGWNGGNRCNATGSVLLSVPMPGDLVIGNSKDNNSAVFLDKDGRTLIHTQPFTRCSSGGIATSMATFPKVDLFGDGHAGSHGGSGLSAIGGSIRVGELRPGQQGPRHALKINIYAKQSLFKCTTRADCSRWPATKSDSYAVGFYGTANNNSNRAMKMGALLAIPPSKTIATMGLETEPARQLAWTLQNYGAYVVDDTYGPAFALNGEEGPDGSLAKQFKADYGMEFEQRVNNNSAWSRDMAKLMIALQVIDNNSPTSIGGGGTPRQPLAPAFQ